MRSDIYEEVARVNRIHRLEIRYKGVGALLIGALICLSAVLTFTVGFSRSLSYLGIS